MFQFIKCNLLDRHVNNCWIVENNSNQVKAMCPYCSRLVIKDNKGIWRSIK